MTSCCMCNITDVWVSIAKLKNKAEYDFAEVKAYCRNHYKRVDFEGKLKKGGIRNKRVLESLRALRTPCFIITSSYLNVTLLLKCILYYPFLALNCIQQYTPFLLILLRKKKVFLLTIFSKSFKSIVLSSYFLERFKYNESHMEVWSDT